MSFRLAEHWMSSLQKSTFSVNATSPNRLADLSTVARPLGTNGDLRARVLGRRKRAMTYTKCSAARSVYALVPFLIALTVGFEFAQAPAPSDQYGSQRLIMVRDQVEARGVKNPEVLAAMRTIPRELFVPEGIRPLAYADQPLPIGFGQTISQPFIVALMTELLDPKKDHRVLEIGTGSGYQAAILSRLAGELYSIEIVPELARSAAETLSRLGFRHVTVREGDGYRGWPEKAPFDRIILTAAPPEIPQVLLDELKPEGRLIAPVGVGVQNLVVVQKSVDGKTTTQTVLPVRFVPMIKGKE
jgi:protein-L-isoaspartate(D-aspartate) O-methyltransferase